MKAAQARGQLAPSACWLSNAKLASGRRKAATTAWNSAMSGSSRGWPISSARGDNVALSLASNAVMLSSAGWAGAGGGASVGGGGAAAARPNRPGLTASALAAALRSRRRSTSQAMTPPHTPAMMLSRGSAILPIAEEAVAILVAGQQSAAFGKGDGSRICNASLRAARPDHPGHCVRDDRAGECEIGSLA